MTLANLPSPHIGLAVAKTRVPQVPNIWVAREGLQSRLDDSVLYSRVTLLQAPAGYGKTCILSNWAQGCEEMPLAWLSLDKSDQNPYVFLTNIKLSLQKCGFKTEEKIDPNLIQIQAVPPEILAMNLANEIFANDGKIILCLDDVHILKDSPSLGILALLIENTGAKLHIIISTREMPSILMGRLSAYGDLTEILMQDLRFTQDEAKDFFDKHGPTDLSNSELVQIENGTEGWVTGLKITSMALCATPDRASALATLNGDQRKLSLFFREEILAKLPPALQNFLLKISILESFCANLCDYVCQIDNSQNLIEDCEARGLFLVPLDDSQTWYRFHHLFAEFMQKRLNKHFTREITVLHTRASDWFLDNEMPLLAYNHALNAKEYEKAGEILESQCDELFNSGQQERLLKLAGKLPKPILDKFPRLQLSIAWRLIAEWEFEQADLILANCRKLLADLQTKPEANKEAIENIKNHLLHREMTIASFHDDISVAEAYANTLETRFVNASPYLKASIYHELLDAERLQFKLQNIDRFAAASKALLAKVPSDHSIIYHNSIVGACYYFAGRTDEAITKYEEGIRIARRSDNDPETLCSIVALQLAYVKYESNDLDAAKCLLKSHFNSAKKLGLVEQLITGWLVQANLYWLEGEKDKTIRCLEEARQFAKSRGFERLIYAVDAEKVNFLIRLGDQQQAAQAIALMGLNRPAETFMPQKHTNMRICQQSLTWSRMALARGQINEAKLVIRPWRRLLQTAQAIPVLLKWEMLHIRALLLEGETAEALRALAGAVKRAQPAQLMRTFLDEGHVIAGLIEKLSLKEEHIAPNESQFIDNILAAFESEQNYKIQHKKPDTEIEIGILGALTRRELQVLNLVATHLSNREVGEALGITEGSVKWYLQQIYSKLGSRNRSEVSRKARHLGLIN